MTAAQRIDRRFIASIIRETLHRPDDGEKLYETTRRNISEDSQSSSYSPPRENIVSLSDRTLAKVA
jgi:hypothetical protein